MTRQQDLWKEISSFTSLSGGTALIKNPFTPNASRNAYSYRAASIKNIPEIVGNPHSTMSIELALRVNKGLSSDGRGNFADIASYQIEKDSATGHSGGAAGGLHSNSSFNMLATLSDDEEEEGEEPACKA